MSLTPSQPQINPEKTIQEFILVVRTVHVSFLRRRMKGSILIISLIKGYNFVPDTHSKPNTITEKLLRALYQIARGT